MYISMIEENIPLLTTINMGYSNGNALYFVQAPLLYFFEVVYTLEEVIAFEK